MSEKDIVVKQFVFPSFDTWQKSLEWSSSIGVFNIRIARVSWSTGERVESTYQIGISVGSNPLNMYTSKIWSDGLTCLYTDTEKLRRWYERVTVESNEAFARHVLSYMV